MTRQKLPFILLVVSVILTALSFSCKTRQYEKTSTSSTSTSVSQAKMDSMITAVNKTRDTGTVDSGSIITTNDSTHTTTKLTPDSGTTITVSPDGTISGKFSSITTTKSTKERSTKNSTSHTQKAVSSTDSSVLHSIKVSTATTTTKKDSTFKKGKSDSTLGANIPWYDWLIGVLALAGLAYLIIRNWKGIVAV